MSDPANKAPLLSPLPEESPPRIPTAAPRLSRTKATLSLRAGQFPLWRRYVLCPPVMGQSLIPSGQRETSCFQPCPARPLPALRPGSIPLPGKRSRKLTLRLLQKLRASVSPRVKEPASPLAASRTQGRAARRLDRWTDSTLPSLLGTGLQPQKRRWNGPRPAPGAVWAISC